MRDVIAERGNFRAVIEHDGYPDEPMNDGGCPIIRADSNRTSAHLTDVGYGNSDALGFDAVDALAHFWVYQSPSNAIATFERYVRAFHEGSVETWSDRDGTYYIAVSTRTLANTWGIPEDEPVPAAELDEWQAYCEGEVYVAMVEERATTATTTWDGTLVREEETWEITESCGGHYGEIYAKEAAKEMLDELTPKCSQCDEGNPIDEHGMCSSCLHNAYRSGWQPGKDD